MRSRRVLQDAARVRARRAKPVDGTLPGLIVTPGSGVSAPVVVFSEKPSRLADARRVLLDHVDDSCPPGWSAMPIGFRPTFTVVGVPSVLSELMGKMVMPPGPGFAGVYSSVPFALFW